MREQGGQGRGRAPLSGALFHAEAKLHDYLIRPGDPGDAAELPALEAAAARLFATAGLPGLVELPPQPAAFYRACAAEGGLWVAERAGIPVPAGLAGFAAMQVRDGEAWLAEIGVVPAHGRRGLGGRLLAAATGWALSAGLPAVVLTTFRDIPFNAPFYRRYGFLPFEPGVAHPFLSEVRREEKARGLDLLSPRIAMRLDLCAARTPSKRG